MEEMVIGRWLSEAVLSRRWCDVSILCGGRHFWAHRLVLSTASPFIRGLLLSRPSDDIPTTIVFADVSHHIVEALLQYIYSGEVSVLPEHVDDFLALTQVLKIHVDLNSVNDSILNVKETEPIVKDEEIFANNIKNNEFKNSNNLGALLNSDKKVLSYDSFIKTKSALSYNYNKAYLEKIIVDRQKFLMQKLDKNPSKDTILQNLLDYNCIPSIRTTINGTKNTFDTEKSIITNSNNLESRTMNETITKNDKLVRPIPSLMPIDRLIQTQIPEKIKQTTDILDLSSLNGSRKRNSAFELVNSGRNLSQNHNNHQHPDRRIFRKIPQNRVLDSPWSTKGPIFYRRTVKRCDEKARDEDSSQSTSSSTIQNPINESSNHDVPRTPPINDNNNNTFETATKTIEDRLPPPIKDIVIKDTSPRKETPTKESATPATVVNQDDDACASKCPSCSKMFTSRSTLAAHVATHSSRARYRCDQCDKSFSQLRNYKYHVSVHKGTKEFAATCNVCGKYFNDRGYLSSHMKIHRNRKEYQCPHCPKSFNQRVAYNMHVRIHTGVKPHQCESCGKAFSRKMLLKQHARTHSGEKPYACTSCGKRFADRSNMTLHMRLHSGVKPFSCTLCPKSFTKKHHLKTHLNYHTGDKPYACAKCGLTFSQSSNMRTHMKKCSASTSPETSETSSVQDIKFIEN